MNSADRQYMKRLRIALRLPDPRQAVIEADMVLAEWQESALNYGQEPGHTDKVFNNYGTGRSDRTGTVARVYTPETHPWAGYAQAMRDVCQQFDL